MSAVPVRAPASRWRAARVWIARLAGNAAGFAVCYVLLSALLWALGDRYLAPLVPHANALYNSGDGVMYREDYVRAIAWVMCVPSAIFALALTGFALWRRRLWYLPGPLLGLLLGDMRDYADVWNMHSCGGAWHATPHSVALLANGLVLVLVARPTARTAHRRELPMPGTRWLRLARSTRMPALLALLALVGMLLAGCENSVGHHVGDTISNADVRITLTTVTVVPADASFQPAAGDELVRLHVRYTNRSQSALGFSEVMFALKNGEATSNCGTDPRVGCSIPRDGTYFLHGAQGVGPHLVQPGATVESDILFEVGKSAHDARLVFQPDGLQDIANFWWLLGL